MLRCNVSQHAHHSPVLSVPEITYTTRTCVTVTDADGLDLTSVTFVNDQHSLKSSSRVGMPLCLADGDVYLVVDGKYVFLARGDVMLTPHLAIAAVNLLRASRSYGFEVYWERKNLEVLFQSDRVLRLTSTIQEVSDWVRSDTTATNHVE